jgi:hypothetical protein
MIIRWIRTLAPMVPCAGALIATAQTDQHDVAPTAASTDARRLVTFREP